MTALIVQDALGGDLLRSTVNGESHYWNRLPDGSEIDLTLEQFGGDAAPDAPPILRERDEFGRYYGSFATLPAGSTVRVDRG